MRGIYGDYMVAYARVNEYYQWRKELIMSGMFFDVVTEKLNIFDHKFFNCYDMLMNFAYREGGEDNLNYEILRRAMSDLMFYMPQRYRSINWSHIVTDFGEEYKYERKIDPHSFYFSDVMEECSSASTAYTSSTTHRHSRTRHEAAHEGRWYDRYYNRGRNNINTNNRWRR